MSQPVRVRRLSPNEIAARKGREPIVCLTAYTAPTARLLDAEVDLILVGDVCYARGASEALARHLRNATAPVLLGDPGRQFLPREGMHLLATYPVATSLELEAASITQASVWRMQRPKA